MPNKKVWDIRWSLRTINNQLPYLWFYWIFKWLRICYISRWWCLFCSYALVCTNSANCKNASKTCKDFPIIYYLTLPLLLIWNFFTQIGLSLLSSGTIWRQTKLYETPSNKGLWKRRCSILWKFGFWYYHSSWVFR